VSDVDEKHTSLPDYSIKIYSACPGPVSDTDEIIKLQIWIRPLASSFVKPLVSKLMRLPLKATKRHSY
jgi:hypothetical protein